MVRKRSTPSKKRPRRKTSAGARANAKNSTWGGGRSGAGRKPKARFLDAYRAAGRMPKDPLARVAWVNHMLAIDLELIITGRGDRAVSQELRALSRALNAGIPKERLWRAEQVVLGDADVKKRMRKDPPLTDVTSEPGSPISGVPPRG